MTRLYNRGDKGDYATHFRIIKATFITVPKDIRYTTHFSLDLTRLRPDHALLHNRSATSLTSARISLFHTFSVPSSASLPFNVSPPEKRSAKAPAHLHRKAIVESRMPTSPSVDELSEARNEEIQHHRLFGPIRDRNRGRRRPQGNR